MITFVGHVYSMSNSLQRQITRRITRWLIFTGMFSVPSALPVWAEEPKMEAAGESKIAAHPQPMKEDTDGELVWGEFVTVNKSGSVTRAKCPYTCEDRGIPKESCKADRSASKPDLCYVQDLRMPTDDVLH